MNGWLRLTEINVDNIRMNIGGVDGTGRGERHLFEEDVAAYQSGDNVVIHLNIFRLEKKGKIDVDSQITTSMSTSM